MGVKSTHAALTYAPAHYTAANKAGHSIPGIHGEVQLLCVELIMRLQLLQSTMQIGDGNIATLASLITALS
jgi:hypothetical protein